MALWVRYVRAVEHVHAPSLLPGGEDDVNDGDPNWPASESRSAIVAAVTAAASGKCDDAKELPEASSAGVKRVRDALERALTAAGLHLADGADLWLLFEGLELRLLCGVRAAAPGERGAKEQVERVRAMYRRRLAVPLLDIEAAHQRFDTWERAQTAEGGGGSEGGDESGKAASRAALDRAYDTATREE